MVFFTSDELSGDQQTSNCVKNGENGNGFIRIPFWDLKKGIGQEEKD
jgi:hypothetical protein